MNWKVIIFIAIAWHFAGMQTALVLGFIYSVYEAVYVGVS
jgi:hypothetical protein